ncbi:hypothetical protein F7725_006717 [Dissostichus mawsoni]|uniref:Uncharacterized protein n=1 Tax=Dissostichus mawsoni TaxID=36200 RepID=A0A7J5XUR4_DISMA|nr:hypothetical protein F7725_006717 [Dissostichus mawsoni]
MSSDSEQDSHRDREKWSAVTQAGLSRATRSRQRARKRHSSAMSLKGRNTNTSSTDIFSLFQKHSGQSQWERAYCRTAERSVILLQKPLIRKSAEQTKLLETDNGDSPHVVMAATAPTIATRPPISPSPPLAGRPSPPSLMFPPDTSCEPLMLTAVHLVQPCHIDGHAALFLSLAACTCPCTFGEADVSSTPEVPAAGPQWAGPRLVGFRTQWLLQQAGSGSALRLKQTKARERRRAAILLQHRRTHSHTLLTLPSLRKQRRSW